MQEDKFVSYSKIIEVLRMHCAVKDSGTMFITTNTNEAIRIVLDSGNIISIAIRRERGILALDAIKDLKSGRFKFSKDATFSVDGTQQLPTTKEIISLLLKYAGRNKPAVIKQPVRNNANSSQSAQPPEETIDVPEKQIIPKETIRTVIEPELIEQMGPVGTMICEDHLETIDDNPEILVVEQMIRNIAAEIKSEIFRQNVELKLFGSTI